MWKQTLRTTVFVLGLIVLLLFVRFIQNKVRIDSRIKKLKLIEKQIKVVEYDIERKEFFGDPDDDSQPLQPTGSYSMSHLIAEYKTGRLYMKRNGIDITDNGNHLFTKNEIDKVNNGNLLSTKYEYSFEYSFDGTISLELDYSGNKAKGLIYSEPLLSRDNFPFSDTGLTIFPGFFGRRGIINTIQTLKNIKL